MDDLITIEMNGGIPLLAAAIHNGHRISENLKGLLSINESDRFREEDPFTGIWTNISSNRIVAHHSRFEFDLNRPPEGAVYRTPEDSWGLKVWKNPPPAGIIENSQKKYSRIYKKIHEGLTEMAGRFGAVVIFDLHSYNHRRSGEDSPPADISMNPEINVGTGTMNRTYWASLLDRFMDDLTEFDFFDRHLDVRENIKFKGGYFPRWIHQNFNKSVCCISVEVKKFFMNEWTGVPDHSIIQTIGEALRETIPGVLEELSIREAKI